MSWYPRRRAGLERLRRFVAGAGRAYARGRNHDPGPEESGAVSKLSPWLRHRLLTESEVVAAALAVHGYQAAEKFIQEVFWRTYFKGWLEHRPQVWQSYLDGLREARDRLDSDPDLRDRWESAVEGATGIECFDAWSRELVEHNWLHNHARMWYASIWIFTLELPWQLGADFFLRHLLDGDAASNTLSWRWVGGLHTPGKTYLARPDNIGRYTGGRFEPSSRELAGSAEALTESGPGPRQPVPDPPPVPELDGAALLLSEDELHPESLPVDLGRFRWVGIVDCSGHRSPQTVSEPVRSFTAEAIGDTLARLDAAGVEACRIDTADALDWWLAAGPRDLVVPQLPVGPARDRLAALADRCPEHGITVHSLLRPWDARAWPHAGHGFLRLKKRIPELLPEPAGVTAEAGHEDQFELSVQDVAP